GEGMRRSGGILLTGATGLLGRFLLRDLLLAGPAVIVGDSRTGSTSSDHGFYRFLALGDRLARPSLPGRRSLPLRLPFTGEEPRNLVPVDWVARAVVQILHRPMHHGRTFHLASEHPTPARRIKEVAEELLALDGVPGRDRAVGPTPANSRNGFSNSSRTAGPTGTAIPRSTVATRASRCPRCPRPRSIAPCSAG